MTIVLCVRVSGRSNVMVVSALFVILTCVCNGVIAITHSSMQIPKYHVDLVVQSILVEERLKCMATYSEKDGASALKELEYVRSLSAAEYYRSHELFAHNFFIESGALNPHRVNSYEEAEFEYIPLLSLYWATMLNSNNKKVDCDYRQLMSSVLKVQAYLVARDGKHTTSGGTIKPKFAVASTFNLRTVLGTGMPTQLRKGEAWESVSSFVAGLSIGHYERWPQCPDLLRMSFKYVIELPYVVTTTTTSMSKKGSIVSKQKQFTSGIRKHMFFFAGNFELFGPEMVCSVRNELINIASRRNDTLIVNSTTSDANSALHLQKLQHAAHDSVFCLIAKADSYSTSFLYLALHAGCIPVVISDWFVFAFPWLIPYEQFVLRLQEGDFVQNPDFVLDHIVNTIGTNKALLSSMRSIMYNYKHILSFDPVEYTTDRYRFGRLPQSDVYFTGAAKVSSGSVSSSVGSNSGSSSNKDNSKSNTPTDRSKSFKTYLPLELLLLELRYNQQPHQYYNNIPCLRPSVCARDHIANTSYVTEPLDYVFPAKSRLRTIERTFVDTSSSGSSGGGTVGRVVSAGYSVINDGYQVKAVFIPNLVDVRTHLCRHAMRLIGSYKVVFFMQCVRILWPLHPGTFKPVDNAARHLPGFDSTTFVSTVARYRGGKYSVEPDGISKQDMQFVVDFHNATKPPGYRLVNYPVTSDRSRIVPFKDIF